MICPLRAEHGGGQALAEEWSAGIILRQSANLMFLGGRPSPIVGPPRLFTGGRIVFQQKREDEGHTGTRTSRLPRWSQLPADYGQRAPSDTMPRAARIAKASPKPA